MALTAAATVFVWWGSHVRNQALFTYAVRSAQDRITGRLDVYVATLRGGAALFWASDEVTRDEFAQYVERLGLEQNYPGMQGMGWSRRVRVLPEADPDERHVIAFLEPMDARNRAAVGFDMYADSSRRDAMRRARDMGEPALSGKVRLVQEVYGPQQAGLLLYVPVYDSGGIPATIEGRRAGLIGFVYGAFRAGDLFRGIFGSEEHPLVSLCVYDGGEVRPDALIYASRTPRVHDPAYMAETSVQIAGRTWRVLFASQPEFEAGSSRGLVLLVLFGGLVASGVLFGLARGQARARVAAESANLAKSTFLATMSHELRTPLNAIGGYVDLMLQGIPEPVSDAHRAYLARILRAQRHLRSLIGDVLDFARLEAGRVEVVREAVRVADAVDEAESLVSPAVESGGLLYDHVGGPDVAMAGDAEAIRQILVNLLSNAIKFTDRGGRIWTTWSSEGGRVRLTVADAGIGIRREDLEKIFQPFAQADGDLTRVRQGTGLGLAISRSLAEAMGGAIEVESEPGTGSRFTLDLPCADVDGPPGAVEDAAAHG